MLIKFCAPAECFKHEHEPDEMQLDASVYFFEQRGTETRHGARVQHVGQRSKT